MKWEEADMLFRKTLIFLMQRMQKPVYITVGKFVPANTQLFLGVSAHVVTVKKTIRQRKVLVISLKKYLTY